MLTQDTFGAAQGRVPETFATALQPQINANMRMLINLVRLYTRDQPELNRLIAGYESSDQQIMWAIIDALSDWNNTPPRIGFVDITTHPAISLLVRGITISLLESVGLLMTRNHLSFSDGGIQVGINDKTPFIQSWLQLLRNNYEEKKLKLKIALNIEQSWGGGVWSEFALLSASGMLGGY
jgi:hypothetical protein